MRYITGRPTAPAEVRDRFLPEYLADYERLGGLGRWVAEERATGAFVGWFSLRPVERGRRPPWSSATGCCAMPGAGVTRPRVAGRCWSWRSRTFGAERVVAQTMTVNTRSRAVMERLGMRLLRSFTADWGEDIPGAELGDVEYVIELP